MRQLPPAQDGAALGVFTAEPLAPEHPFWHHPKIVVTPHDACEVRVKAVATAIVATADAIRTGRRTRSTGNAVTGYSHALRILRCPTSLPR